MRYLHQFFSLGLAIACLSGTGEAFAQLYKSVGPDGRWIYSDTPPPPGQKLVETRSLSKPANTASLPYELALAVQNAPVTVYTGNNCAPCQDAKNLLRSQGVPYTEKTVTTDQDIEKFQQISGDTQLPFLQIGGQRLRGFTPEEIRQALQNSGYPTSSRLPSDYKNPPAEALVPVATAASPATGEQKNSRKKVQNIPKPAKQEQNTGFQF
ncbi:glutaredoxin family protein [Undibacterium squillarum]|uniref:glutaredoxin family protein n=1 Tax=Undibacterium squillarum TaxID=1131567 RepID=UPI0035AE6A44